MKIPSSRTFVWVGFAISCASVIINTFVLSSIDSRLQAVDSEYSGLAQALQRQQSQLNEADLKFDLYRVMHHLAFSSPPATAQDARRDAKEILLGFLVRFYAAANDISLVEVTRIAVEEAGEVLPRLGRFLEVMHSLSIPPGQADWLVRRMEDLGGEPPPKSELARNLREVGTYADAETTAVHGIELSYKLLPLMMSLSGQIVASIDRKESRMRELERERSSLARTADQASYAAISLQIFGLMFILVKDIAKDFSRDPRDGREIQDRISKY